VRRNATNEARPNDQGWTDPPLIGIDKIEEYVAIAAARIRHALLTPDPDDPDDPDDPG